MSKLGMLTAGAVGYVLGARAGRERYDQIVFQAQRLWTDPRVQRASQQAQEFAKEKGPEIGAKVADKVGEKLPTSSATESSVTSDSATYSA